MQFLIIYHDKESELVYANNVWQAMENKIGIIRKVVKADCPILKEKS